MQGQKKEKGKKKRGASDLGSTRRARRNLQRRQKRKGGPIIVKELVLPGSDIAQTIVKKAQSTDSRI